MLVVTQASTDVLVGIKAELAEPVAGFPDDGYIEFAVDWYEIKLKIF